MATYKLRNGANVLVAVKASSNLDGEARPSVRRGTFFHTLGAVAVQYMESAVVGDIPIVWDIPLADGSQRGILRSASVGAYADTLVFESPKYGDISVAVMPGPEGYEEEWLPPLFGYRIRIRLVRV